MNPLLLPEGLLPGDRLPNFMRHDADDRPVVYYDRYCGEAIALLVVLDMESQAARSAVKAIADLPGAAPVIMIEGDPQRAAAFRSGTGTECRVLADDGQIIRYLFGGQLPDAPVAVFAVDANAHVRGRWMNWPGVEAIEAALPDPAAGRLITHGAPALMIPEVFEDDFCRHLIEVYQSDNEPSGILRKVDGRLVYEADDSAKIRREHRIQDKALLQAIEQRLVRRVVPEIQWTCNYPITQYEAIKVVSYDADSGGYFRTHRDNNGVDTAHRRFALTLNLNSHEYEGGELNFPEYGPDRYKPPAGGAVVFSCSLAHQALPVTRGCRYALVSFFFGADSKVQKVDAENRIRR